MNALPIQQWVIAFRWNYNGNSINKQISKQEAARDNFNGAIIRIGREKPSCNLYLEDSSVSGQHAEVYFNEQQQKFFIKSLQPRNTTKVDGQDLVYGEELPLKESSTIVLGLQKIEVTNIQVFELQSTNYSGIVNSSQNSNQVNPNSIPVNLNINLKNVDSNKSKHWWQEPTIQVAIITALVAILTTGVTWYSNYQTRQTEKEKVDLQTYSAEKLDYIKRLTNHKTKVIEILEKDEYNNLVYKRLTLNSNCDQTVNFAVTFEAPNGIQQTKGWFTIDKNDKDIVPGFYTLKSNIYLYAFYKKSEPTLKNDPESPIKNYQKSLQNQESLNAEDFREWSKDKGFITLTDDQGIVERNVIHNTDFDYIENPLFINKDKKDIIGKATFYTIKLPVPKSGSYSTKKRFDCDENSLKLKDE